ncbi:MAG TPA: glycosyltransferase family 2 protein [Leptolyngbyaceae cyanobacterium M65_K2018_010]|nr:glycosyltransferase family 2 protein [Leptolyngbyaceae cyanobacterium M65_K2018_010]
MFLTLLSLGLGVIALALLIPCLMLFAEIGLAAWRRPLSPCPLLDSDRATLAVLMPAHNEAAGLGKTLAGLLPELQPQDRILVVADNCNDETAAIARAAGAQVVERNHPTQRGKGYALDYGLKHLQQNPPDVVVFMDADCDLEAGGLRQLAEQALAVRRPVQANYLIQQPPTASLKSLISAFAVKVKNLVRPLGLQRMGAPCLLTGTGIALPWDMAIAVDIASGHIAEDMKWGLDLALAGYAPTYLPTVQVTSRLPNDIGAAKVQRTRWEHGHLQIMGAYLPRLFGQALRQRRWDLLALALELSIPPLSLLVMIWASVTVITLLFALGAQIWLPLYMALVAGSALLGGVALAWSGFGRSELSLGQLVMIPAYLLWKIPLYVAFLIRPEQRWVRTQRDS